MRKFTMYRYVTLLLLVIISFCTNAQTKSDINNYYDYDATLVDVGQDGTKVITITVVAKKVADGIELAKRNAVAACLFKGVEGSYQAERVLAIVPQGISTDNEQFFNEFLAIKDKKGEGGEYLRFVAKTGNERSEKIKKGYKVSLDVQVSYNALRDYMVSQGKAKSLNFLF